MKFLLYMILLTLLLQWREYELQTWMFWATAVCGFIAYLLKDNNIGIDL